MAESNHSSEASLAPPEKSGPERLTELPFPPLTKAHILNCSYPSWHARYRAVTPKARTIKLSVPFVEYLRADGIVVPPESDVIVDSDADSGIFTDDSDEPEVDPSADWPEIHESIKRTIAELGGKVVPKLNWSAPKDATFMLNNSMECRTPNDVYLLLKSSDFVTHDLDHAFDDCADGSASQEIDYYLVLRKHVELNPALEFRCFVRKSRIIGICQRDQNHFEFLFEMQDRLVKRIQAFFDEDLRDFPDDNFVFDVYIPPPYERVWLIDFNPWAQRTDPLLFSWLELLTDSNDVMNSGETAGATESVEGETAETAEAPDGEAEASGSISYPESESESESDVVELFRPEFRLIRRDDPEAYSFSTPQYSAHKLPRDVVDASTAGPTQMREFAEQWKEILKKQEQESDGEN